MAREIKRGETVFIPFVNGKSVTDSQLRPRMYKTKEQFRKNFRSLTICRAEVDLVEYAEIVHGTWIPVPSSDMMTGKAYKCSNCKKIRYGSFQPNYCAICGAKMDGDKHGS